MANILAYLDWRGDLSFRADPFNEIDNYICSQMGTPDLSLIVAEGAQQIALRNALETYGSLWGERGDKLGVLSSPLVLPLLRKCADTVRYGGVRLSHFVNFVDEVRAEQFSAVCVHLPDGSCYVAYRGTDDSIMGWKEDFLLSVLDWVPAQRDALEYLERIAADVEGELILGGHSKGGNLAIYAAVNAPEEIQNRIRAVYNNDGPGFRENIQNSAGYARMAERIVSILPQHSVVGVLLEQSGHPVIVKSSKAGPESHDGLNWEVLGAHFVRCEDFSRSSKAMQRAMDNAIDGKTQAERREFVDDFFLLLTSSGARTLTEFFAPGSSAFLTLFRQSRRIPAIHSFVSEVAKIAMREYAGDVAEDMAEDVRELRKKLLRREES